MAFISNNVFRLNNGSYNVLIMKNNESFQNVGMIDTSGFIEYKDPLEYIKGFLPKKCNNWKEIQAKTGDTLLFPGWIRHRTQPNNLLKDRWVLTTNFIGNAK